MPRSNRIERTIILLTLMFSLGNISGFSQAAIEPERITTEDGLSQGHIKTVYQDREGFIWLGTLHGLNRFDGHEFKVFTPDSRDSFAITTTQVFWISEYNDYLLFADASNRINIFHKKTERFFEIVTADLKGWKESNIKGVWRDEKGRFVSHSHEVVFPPKFWDLLPSNISLIDEIKIVGRSSKPKNNQETRLERYSYTYNVPAGVQIPKFTNDSTIDSRIHFQSNQFLVTGQLSSIDIYDGKKLTQLSFDFNVHRVIVEESKMNLWLQPKNDHNLYLIDLKTIKSGTWKKEAASATVNIGSQVVTHHIDRSGIIWMGTNGYGLLKLKPRQASITAYLTGKSITTAPFSSKNGEIFLGGRIVETKGDPAIATIARLCNPMAKSKIVKGESGKLYLIILERKGTVCKLFEITQSGDSHLLMEEKEENSKWKLLAARLINNKVCISAMGKFMEYDLNTADCKITSIDKEIKINYNFDIAKTSNGQYWIATSKGLLCGTTMNDNLAFEPFHLKNGGVENSQVATLLTIPGQEHILWVGTKGGGLHKMNVVDGTIKSFNQQNGFPDIVIYGILTDDNDNLWMSSNNGIIYLETSSETWKNFTRSDGMLNTEFNTSAYGKSDSGELFFGGLNGLISFYPGDIKLIKQTPKAFLTALWINNKEVKARDDSRILKSTIGFTESLELSHLQNSISLQFAAMEYSATDRNRFKYYLEGAEEPWSHESTANTTTYLNVSPGKYLFKIKAANGDGLWSEEITSLHISIAPPWYSTIYAYVGYILLLAMGIALLFRTQNNRLKLIHKVELAVKERRKLKEIDQLKSKLYANITHEFRTPLTVISGIASQIRDEGKKKLIARNSNNLLDLVNQMLQLQKLESGFTKENFIQDDIIKFINYLTASYHSYAALKSITIHFLSEVDNLLMDFDQEKTHRIFANLLSNAIKFTLDNGDIYIVISKSEDSDNKPEMLRVLVRDTGIGIPEDQIQHIFDRFYQVNSAATRYGEGTGIGLALVKELIEFLNGEISVTSEAGKGTSFTLNLPITNHAEIVSLDEHENDVVHDSPIPGIVTPPVSVLSNSTKKWEYSILIVDDNRDIVEYLKSCFKGSYDLLIAANGEEGIEVAIDKIPDLVISDVVMPRKDGYELCETLKNDSRTSHIPIVLLTAKADLTSRLEGLSRGADAYLSKPFDQHELRIEVKKLISLRKVFQDRYQSITAISETDSPDLQIEDEFIAKFKKIVVKHLQDEDFNVIHICQALNVSRSQLYRKVAALTGKSPAQLQRSIRLEMAKALLQKPETNVSEVCYKVGFRYPSNFTKTFKAQFGISPKEMKEKV